MMLLSQNAGGQTAMLHIESRKLLTTTMLLLATVPLFASAATAAASGAPGDDFLERFAATGRFRLGRPAAMRPTPDGRAILFLRSGARDFVRNLYELDLESGSERLLLTAEQILAGEKEQLTEEEKARRERMRLAARGIASFDLSSDGKRILVPLGGRLFIIERGDGEILELKSDSEFPIDPRLSPDGRRVACVRDGELYVIDIESGEERRLTHGAGGAISHGLAEFVAQEEMGRYRGYWWSPDSERIAYQMTDTSGVELLNIMDASHPERPPTSWPYPRPGKANAKVRLGVMAATGGDTLWIDWDQGGHYEYLARVVWSEKAPLTILVQNREQTEQRLLAVDVSDGSTRSLLVERDEAWVEIDPKMPFWLPDGSGFLWTTDREGATTLEHRDRRGRLVSTVVGAEVGLQEFEHYIDKRKEVIVRASTDPTSSHIYRFPLDPAGGRRAVVAQQPGTHDILSPSRAAVYVKMHENLDGTRRYEAFDERGSMGVQLKSVAEHPGVRPNVELTTVGKDIVYHAAIIRPSSFKQGRRYPVIVHVYGGPGAQLVRAAASRFLLDQWMADQGYVVVSIDGRGTPGRGRQWSRAIKNDLIALPLEDQVTALKLLGERYDELDLSKVGIHGWSFGGYFAAMALMRHPDTFHAGVAVAPVSDWMDYDTHYTERYMGLPQENAEGYKAASLLTYAGGLRRPLLLVHGTADDNVYLTHSLKLIDGLFRAGRYFEFLPLPGFTHIVPEPLATMRLYERIMEHFAMSLGGS
jgi:dipeptidyl-peptidase-4